MTAALTDRDVAAREPRPAASLLLGAWAALGLVLILQGVLERAFQGGVATTGWLLRWRVYPWALWGLAAPGFAWIGRRVPLGWPPRPPAVILHAALFGAWMLASNALLRIPEILGHGDFALARTVFAAATHYSVPGALAYGLIVSLGGRLRPTPEPNGSPKRLSLSTGERIHLVHVDDVRWIEADGDHVRVHTTAGPHRVRGRMKEFERQLSDDRFLRVHRSTIVNVDFVRELQPYLNGDYVAVLRDGTTLRIPRTRRQVIAAFLGG